MKESVESETPGPCPLCPGNESLSPPEVARVGEGGQWHTRAFPNRYPAVRLEAEASFSDLRDAFAPFSAHPGFGAHEVVVASPSHLTPFWDLDLEEMVSAWKLTQGRIRDLYQDGRIRYAQVFLNHGAAAGASIEHPHLQILALPFVPAPARRLLEAPECLVCRVLSHETGASRDASRRDGGRLILESKHFAAFVDFAPRYPYQFSIYPKGHASSFQDCPSEEIADLAQIFSTSLHRLQHLLGSVGLNVALYTMPNEVLEGSAPAGSRSRDAREPGAGRTTSRMHWFLRVFPRTTRHAGFELGAKIPIVQVSPEDVAHTLRNTGA